MVVVEGVMVVEVVEEAVGVTEDEDVLEVVGLAELLIDIVGV